MEDDRAFVGDIRDGAYGKEAFCGAWGWVRVVWKRSGQRLRLEDLGGPERLARRLYMASRYKGGTWSKIKRCRRAAS